MNEIINGNLAYQEEPREEIIGGKVVLMAPAASNHMRIARNITRIFDSYLLGRPCEYFPDGTGLYLDEDADEYQPDGMVICDPEKVKYNGIYGTPDFVMEILSPSTARYDRGRKKDMYERHGVREYWIVSPLELSVEQYVLENGRFVLRDVYHKYSAEALESMKEKERSAVVTEFSCSLFPELTIRLDDVFARVAVS